MYDTKGVPNEQNRILKRKPDFLRFLQKLQGDIVTAADNAEVTPLGVTMTVSLQGGYSFNIGAVNVGGKLDVAAFEESNAKTNPHNCMMFVLSHAVNELRINGKQLQKAATELLFEAVSRAVELALHKKAEQTALLESKPELFQALSAIKSIILSAVESAAVTPDAVTIPVKISGRDFVVGVDVIGDKLSARKFEGRSFRENQHDGAMRMVFLTLESHNIQCSKTKDAALAFVFAVLEEAAEKAIKQKRAA